MKMGIIRSAKCRLLFMLSLTTGFFLVEIIVGYVTNSMALIADSFHMLSDVVALVIAYVSVRMSPKKWSKNTFGWARAEVLGALINAVFLVALCFSILVESLKRFYDPEEVHKPELILGVGAIGLFVNVIGLFLFKGHGHGHSHGGHGHSHNHHHHVPQQEDINDNQVAENGTPTPPLSPIARSGGQMNMHGVFLHVMADALGSVIVIISASILAFTDWEYSIYVDPALSIIMVCIIFRSTWPLLIESAMILLQTVPTHIQVDSLQKKLLQEIEGVLAVHEFHVWQLAGDRIIASAHIRCHNLADYMQIAEKVKEFFHNEGIHSTTIQPEFVDFDPGNEIHGSDKSLEKIENCVLDCPPLHRTNCVASTCCGPQRDKNGKNGTALNIPSSGESEGASPPSYHAVLRRNNRNRSSDNISLNGFYSVSVVPSSPHEPSDNSGV